MHFISASVAYNRCLSAFRLGAYAYIAAIICCANAAFIYGKSGVEKRMSWGDDLDDDDIDARLVRKRIWERFPDRKKLRVLFIFIFKTNVPKQVYTLSYLKKKKQTLCCSTLN